MPFTDNAPILSSTAHSPLGPLLLASQGDALLGIWFDDQAGIPPWAMKAEKTRVQGVMAEAQRQLEGYFEGSRKSFDLPLRWMGGTAFQQAVWQALTAIPFGVTTTYGAISQAIGKPKAVRAVGGAIGRNPLGIVVPCHRVVGSAGQLTGYTGGLSRKQALLALEAQNR